MENKIDSIFTTVKSVSLFLWSPQWLNNYHFQERKSACCLHMGLGFFKSLSLVEYLI